MRCSNRSLSALEKAAIDSRIHFVKEIQASVSNVTDAKPSTLVQNLFSKISPLLTVASSTVLGFATEREVTRIWDNIDGILELARVELIRVFQVTVERILADLSAKVMAKIID